MILFHIRTTVCVVITEDKEECMIVQCMFLEFSVSAQDFSGLPTERSKSISGKHSLNNYVKSVLHLQRIGVSWAQG